MFSHALRREEHCKQISLACVHSDSATQALPPTHGVCAFPVYTAQPLGCSARNCLMRALVCMHFPGIGFSGSSSQVLHKGAELVGPLFCARPRSKQLRQPGAWRAHSSQLGGAFYHLPGLSRLVSWVHSRSTVSGVPCVSSGALISGCDPPGVYQLSRISGRLG